MASALAGLNLAELEKQHNLPSGLLSAVAQAESGGDPNAVSPKGALGMFQFMPNTAKAYGVDPYDPQSSAIGAARMYADLSKQFGGDVPSMLAAYNWGSGNLTKKGLENAPKETRDYIAKVQGMLPKQYADSGQIMSDALPEGFTIDTPEPGLPEGFTIDTPISQPEANSDATSAFLDNLAQGAFGLGDEASAALAAGYLSATQGKPFGETYEKGLDIKRRDLAAQSKESPYASLAGQIVGGVGSGLQAGRAVSSALGKFAPQVSQALGGAIAANPIKSAAGLGSLQGALYGAGTGEGGVQPRLESAATGGIIGAGVGGLAGYGGKAISDKLAKSAQGGTVAKIANTFGRKAPKETATGIVSVEESFIPQLSQKQGEIFSKTAGQRLQNAEIQRLENSALAGNLSPTANQALKDVVTIQNQQFKGFVNKLAGGIDEAADANSLMENVANSVKTSADDAWGAVNNAYKLARAGGGVKVSTNDIRQGLFKSVSGLRREMQADLSQMPQAKAVIKRLARYTGDSKGSKISAVKLNELENWRTMASTAAKNAQGSEAAFLKGMVRKYDDFMQATASEAVDAGDSAAINAFKQAVKSRRDYGNVYESNKLVESIVEGNKSIEDVTKDLLGAGAIKGRKEMANNLDAILKAAGKDAPAAKQDLQKAFAHKILKSSESGFAPDSQEKLISPAKLATQLKNLFQEQRTFAEKLYGKEAIEDGLKAIKELELISQKQAKVGSSSGSGEMVEALVKRAGALAKIPFVNAAMDNIAKTSASSKVLRGVDEFMPVGFKPSSAIFSKYQAPISGAVGALSAPRVEPEELPEVNLPTLGLGE